MKHLYVIYSLFCLGFPFTVSAQLDTFYINSQYQQHGYQGGVVIFEEQANTYYLYNEAERHNPTTPASTFKICNSIIGLETGVIANPEVMFPWDSVRRREPWDKDHTLRSAFQHSVVWYYQELARRVGGVAMKKWLDTLNYGNADTSGGIDAFWLQGELRITPQQQIDFLRKLYHNNLPISSQTQQHVKDIMKYKSGEEMTIWAKTGWGTSSTEHIGWFVGFAEADSKRYFFAHRIRIAKEKLATDEQEQQFISSRSSILVELLQRLHTNKK